MLDSHPEILCRGEGRFFGSEHKMGAERMRSLERSLLNSAELQEWAARSGWTRGFDFGASARQWSGTLARALLTGALAGSGKRIAGDKTPLNGPGVVAAIGASLPEARVIHIIRDGRDVAVSGIHHRWNVLEKRPEPTPGQTEELAVCAAYRADPEGFLAAGRSIFEPAGAGLPAADWARLTAAAIEEGRSLGGDRYTEVRYERLLQTPAAELGRLCRFVGAQAAPATIERCVELNHFERASGGRPAGVEDSTAFARRGEAGAWRDVFSAADRDTFRAAAGETLTALGYERGAG